MSLVVLGISHHSAPLELRERFAYAESAVSEVLGRLRGLGWVREGVLVSTCNRVELYADTDLVPGDAARRLRDFLVQDRAITDPTEGAIYALTGTGGAEHLFRVAAGLDSLVLGETEILGQLKKAYDLALREGHTGRVLNRIFQAAFSAAKRVRSETNIQRGNTSVASVAVDLAERIFDSLRDRDVMVIGAGDTSEKTARALLSRGARSLLVSNRSHDRAAALAEELGGRAIHFEAWDREFDRIDIVISSTSAPHYILDRERLLPLLAQRAHRPLLLIDLAVPRDIDPAVKLFDDVYLANVDDLQAIADEHVRARRDEIQRCETILRERVEAAFRALGPVPISAPRLVFE